VQIEVARFTFKLEMVRGHIGHFNAKAKQHLQAHHRGKEVLCGGCHQRGFFSPFAKVSQRRSKRRAGQAVIPGTSLGVDIVHGEEEG
jgi:hypothetical protein